jgi:hypothetical protein
MSKIHSAVILVASLVLSSCASINKDGSVEAPVDTPEFRGVTVGMKELAHDGRFTLQADQPFQVVDANSVLQINFKMLDAEAELEQNSDWILLNKALTRINDLMAEYRELAQTASTLPKTQTADTKAWQGRIKAYDQRLLGLTTMLRSPEMEPIVSPAELEAMVIPPDGETRPFFELLAEHLSNKRQTLYRNAQNFAKSTDEYNVIVRAYLAPQVGEVHRLHVPGYDNIPSKEFKPINRLGLIPTPAEARKLRAEYEGAKLVKASIEEIENNGAEINNNLEQLFEKAEQAFNKLSDDIQQSLQRWKQISDPATLNRIAEVSDNGAQFTTQLKAFQQDYDDLEQLRENLNTFKNKVAAPDTLDTIVNVADNQAEVETLLDQIKKLSEHIKQWPDRFALTVQTGQQALVDIADAQVSEIKAKMEQTIALVKQEAQQTADALLSQLPETESALFFLSNTLFLNNQQKDFLSAAQLLDSNEPGVIPRPLDRLEPAELDLRKSGIVPGDQVEMEVGFVRGDDVETPEKRIKYSGEAVLTHWHRRYSGDLIFARAVEGVGSENFKTNVAVSLEWHYFSREKPRGFWNGLDPGVGLHAASLNQDPDESAEFGAGVNVSLFKGLLRFGYGYNLSVKQDHQYYWVGFGLFSLLNQLNDLKM